MMKKEQNEGASSPQSRAAFSPLIFRKAFRKALVGATFAVAGLVQCAGASLTPVGGQFPPVGNLVGDQSWPSIALGASGGCLVWEDNSITALGRRIRAVRINSELGAEGSPVIVTSAYKSKATGDQKNPKVAVFPDGSAVVVWQQSGKGKVAADQVFVRFLSPSGTPLKSDIRLGASAKTNQKDPAVAVLADGTVVVVWSSFDLDGSMDGVFARCFTSTGAKVGGDIAVNTHTLLNQRQPDVAALSDGGFVVAWVSELQSSSTSVDVYARHFSGSGTPMTGEFRVSQTTNNACSNPSVAGFSNGGFVVVWSQRDDALNFSETTKAQGSGTLSTNGWDIFGRFFAPSPEYSNPSQSSAVRVNANTYGDQFGPKVAASGTNCFVVWTSLGQDGSRAGVYGQLMSSSGVPEAGELKLNTTNLGPQHQPAVTSNGDGKYIGVWSSITGSGGYPVSVNFDIFAQIYLQSSGL